MYPLRVYHMAVEGFPSIVLHDMQLGFWTRWPVPVEWLVLTTYWTIYHAVTAERHNTGTVVFNRYIYIHYQNITNQIKSRCVQHQFFAGLHEIFPCLQHPIPTYHSADPPCHCLLHLPLGILSAVLSAVYLLHQFLKLIILLVVQAHPLQPLNA